MCLREVRKLARHPTNQTLRLTFPLNIANYGATSHHASLLSVSQHNAAKFHALIPPSIAKTFPSPPTSDIFTPYELHAILSATFRNPASRTPTQCITDALAGYKILTFQVDIHDCTSVNLDEQTNMRVTATSACVGADNGRATFAYRILIENLNEPGTSSDARATGRRRRLKSRNLPTSTASSSVSLESNAYQLLGRKWVINDGFDTTEVDQKHTGVVGILPVIGPGETFEYMSGTDTTSGASPGHMSGGFYLARVPEGTESASTDDLTDVLSFNPDHFIEVSKFRLKESASPPSDYYRDDLTRSKSSSFR